MLVLWLISVLLSLVLNTQIAIRRRHSIGEGIVSGIVFGLLSTLVWLALPLGRSRLCEYCRMRIPDNARRCAYCQQNDPFTAPSA